MSHIFLSASVPSSDSDFYAECDPMLIQAALRTFLYTVLGRKHLVFGGHPSISPLILAICEDLSVDNKSAVTIYQSTFFEEWAPKENSRFANLVQIRAASTRESSLDEMRKALLSHHAYEAAVFIGGQQGILDEYAMFKKRHPTAKVLALRSPGGAAAKIASLEAASQTSPSVSDADHDYDELLDYVGLFTTELQIGVDSERNLMPKPSKPKTTPEDPLELG